MAAAAAARATPVVFLAVIIDKSSSYVCVLYGLFVLRELRGTVFTESSAKIPDL
jgi:hypothetical protein